MSGHYDFRPIRLYAGGALNVLTYHPTYGLVAGGDIEGVLKSDNYGDSWRVVNRGFYVDQFHRVASVAWSESESNTIYACVGDAGVSGGFFASTNGGSSWTLRSSTVQFSGNHAGDPLPSSHPRSTGSLVAQGNGIIYVGTYSQGVYRSADNGSNWTNIGLSDGTYFARSLVRDPSNPDTLYVAMYNKKIWKTTNASAATPIWTELTNAPAIVEELRFVGSYLYIAANTSGIFRTVDGGSTWVGLNGTELNTIKSIWLSLDGYVSGSNHVMIVGCKTGVVTTGVGTASMYKLTISGSGVVTYQVLTNTANVTLTMPNGRTWWHSNSPKFQDWPSGSFFIPTYILIDPGNTNRIWVAGTEGVFRSLDGGTNWHNINEGVALTSHRRLAFDPSHSNRLLLASTDWTTFDISDAIAENTSTTLVGAPSKAGVAYDIAVDPLTSKVYAGVGNRDTNTEGKLYSKVYGSSVWVDEQIAGLGNYDPAVADTFNRTVTGGWGTADLGGAWTISTGPTNAYSVTGGIGTIIMRNTSASRNQYLQSVSMQNSEGTLDLQWDRPPVGDYHKFSVLVRAFPEGVSTDYTDNGYAFQVEEHLDGTVGVRIHRFVAGGSASQVGAEAYLEIGHGAQLSMRYRILGTNLNMKVWSGEEPENWTVTTSDNTAALQTVGAVGIKTGGGPSYTAAAVVSVSNLNISKITANPLDPGDKRPLGVAIIRDGSNNAVVLTAVEQDGLWRKVSGSWTKVDSTILTTAQTSRSARFAWAPGSPYVYIFDRASGIYRSANYGVSWMLIWSITSDIGKTGFIVLNPAIPNQLWVSLNAGLYRLDSAHTGTVGSGITAASVTGVTKPGALTFSSEGVLFCVDLPSSSNQLKLLKSVDVGVTWQDVSDGTFKDMANRVSDIGLSPAGRMYVATLCNGVLMGTMSSSQIVH